MKEPEWNVIYFDEKSREVSTYNILQHVDFVEEIRLAFKKHPRKDDFAEAVRRALGACFGCIPHWGVFVKPWPEGREDERNSCNVYIQVMANWDVFIDYLMKFKDHRMFSKPPADKRAKSVRMWELVMRKLERGDQRLTTILAMVIEYGFSRYLFDRNRDKWPISQYEKDGETYWHLEKVERVKGDGSESGI